MNVKFISLLTITALASLAPIKTKAEEKDLYKYLWLDPDKKVYVLQNKLYQKKGTWYGNAGYIKGLNSDFQDTSGLHLNLGHYFHEEFAVEAVYNSYSNSNNDAYKSLVEINGSEPFVRTPKSTMGLVGVWSPFYGKINTFNKIFYFDWSIGLGVGKTTTETNAETVGDTNLTTAIQQEDHTSYLVKTGFRFHATKNINISLEYMNTSYQANGPTINGVAGEEKMRSHGDVIFSIGFSF